MRLSRQTHHSNGRETRPTGGRGREKSWASQIKDRRQLELEFPGDRRREFATVAVRHRYGPRSQRLIRSQGAISNWLQPDAVVEVVTRPAAAISVTAAADQNALRDRTLHALAQEGYRGFGDVAVISDGAEILKRLPRAMPKPTTHIIDWFHIAMKIQPMQQIADHMARSQPDEPETTPPLARRVRAVKWRLWHGRVNRAIRDLQDCWKS